MTKRKHIMMILLYLFTISLVQAQTTDVLCVGNSITWGTGLSDPQHESYPGQLSVLLGDNYIVENRGEPGSTLLRNTEHPYMQPAPSTFSFSRAKPWDIVIICLGTNDSDEDYWIANENFTTDFYSLIDAYKENNIIWGQEEEPVFILGFPPPVFDESNGHRNAPIHDEIIPMVKQIANDSGYTTADFYSALVGKPEMFSDGVHPNIQGSQIMAEVANNAIQKALAVSGPAPNTPTGLKTIPGLYSIGLEWHANLEDDIFQYRIFRSDSQYGFQNIIGYTSSNDTTFSDGNIVLDHIYYYSIDAIDLQGHISGRSSIVSGKTYDQLPPGAPSDFLVALDADSIKLSWSPNLENDLSRYFVYRNTDQSLLQDASSIVATIYPPNSSYNDINYTSSESYFYGVKAMDVSGNQSQISSILNITAQSRPISNDTTITAFEDQIYYFTENDFPFRDPDNHTLDKIIFIEASDWKYFKYNDTIITSNVICDEISKLTFQAHPDEFGESYDAFKYKVINSFGSSSLDTNIVTIDIAPINDEPTLDPIDDIYLVEDSHDIVLPITGIGSGQLEEIQNLSIEIIPNNTSLIKIGGVQYTSPETTGFVTIDPVESVFGSRPVTIRVWDDGGTENGGINYTDETFYLYITPTNDPPIFNFMEKISIDEDSETTILLNGVQAGPWENNQEISISVTSNNTDILPTPVLNYSTPDTSATLTFTTIPNVHGNTSITLFMSDDGGTDLGGTDSTSYIIPVDIIAVNDEPSAFDILAPQTDSTLVISKHNLNETYKIDWENSEDIDNDNIHYNIIFSDALSQLSRYGIESTTTEFYFNDILAATDTISITNDSFSVFASDGVSETLARNSGFSLTIDGRSFAPASLNLDQNFPNPFNHSTLIGFDLPKRSKVSLTIFDILGKEIIKLIDNEYYERGYGTVTWSGLDNNFVHVPAGLYFMQINVDNEIQHKKLLFLK